MFREELNSESLSEERDGKLEQEDMRLFLYFPSSKFFCCIMCFDYDITEKPTVRVSQALQVCYSSNGGSDFMVFGCLFLGIALQGGKKFHRFKKFSV